MPTKRTIFSLGDSERLPDPQLGQVLALRQARAPGPPMGGGLGFGRGGGGGGGPQDALWKAVMEERGRMQREQLQQQGFREQREFQAGQGALERQSREAIAREQLARDIQRALEEAARGHEKELYTRKLDEVKLGLGERDRQDRISKDMAAAEERATVKAEKRREDIGKFLGEQGGTVSQIGKLKTKAPDAGQAVIIDEIRRALALGPDYARAVAQEGGGLEAAREIDARRRAASAAPDSALRGRVTLEPAGRFLSAAGNRFWDLITGGRPTRGEAGLETFKDDLRPASEPGVPSAELEVLRALGAKPGLASYDPSGATDAQDLAQRVERLRRLRELRDQMAASGFRLEPGALGL